ncbi:UPF0764 protein C16orf89 homolog isoform X2 [Chelonus insularis]|uniref:UPF0764 protein C16orf89 homolog isoform X2 n=1 Tax=Chelonus insularis TaxID=460826 RepID=UPI0015891BA6|nr:UPF0764 protein C16orf89 homolog isoform X2 [Chelonus insularis]
MNMNLSMRNKTKNVFIDSVTRTAVSIAFTERKQLIEMILQECFLLWLMLHSVKCSTLDTTIGYLANITFVLYEDIKFLSDRPKQTNLDTIFGLSLAEAHLSAALSSNNIKSLNVDQRYRLDQLFKLCKTSCTQGKKNLLLKYPSNKLIEVILDSAIWIHPINWKRHFTKTKPREKITIPEYETLELIFHGTPKERESDYCLGMLVKNDCELLDTCTEILLKKDGSRGYPLTHRLLMIQVAKARQCKRPSYVNFSTLIEEYCEQIFKDLIDLDSSNFPSISRDLAMEQITLCGMEGYLDFVDNYYIDLVMSWRSPYGCFSAFKPNQRSRYRTKKSTSLMDHGCDSHASGVAAAALGLFIRAYIENYLTPNDE